MVDKVYEIKDCAVVDLRNGYLKSETEIEEYIYESIDSACIYYSDCFEILKQTNTTDFSDYINHYGATTITNFAYYALREAVEESGIIGELVEILEEEFICEECGEHTSECSCEEGEE